MLKELFAYVVGLGEKANAIEVVDLDRNLKLVRKQGTVMEYPVLPPPVAVLVDDLASLALAVTGYVMRLETAKEAPLAFVGQNAVTVLLQPTTDPAHRVVLPLRVSDELAALGKCKEISQRDLITTLRGPLFNTSDGKLLAILRRLDFTRTNTGKAHVGHVKESLGKSVEMAVQSAEGDIPEIVRFDTPLLANADFRLEFALRYALTVDPDTQRCGLAIVGNDLIAAQQQLRETIRDSVKQSLEGVDVIVGEPAAK